MAKGGTFEAHGNYRTKFHDIVIEHAEQVILPSFQQFCSVSEVFFRI